MRGLCQAMILALSALMLREPAFAQEDGKPTYMLANWFPYGWLDEGQPKGILVDIAKALDQALGESHPYSLAPVSRVIRSIKSGEYDLTIIYRGAKLNRQVDHLLDVGCIRSAVVSLKNRPVKNLEDLNGLRVAYSGSGYFVDHFLPHLDVDGLEVANADIMFRMALRGRLDAFVIDDAVLQGYRTGIDPARALDADSWALFAEPYYLESLRLAVSTSRRPGHEDLKKRIRALADDAVFLSGLQATYDQYGLPWGTACLHLAAN